MDRQLLKQLRQDGASIYPTEWNKPPVKKATDYLGSYKGWVYSCIQKNAESFSDLELMLFRGDRVNNEQVEAHEALDILYFVNNYMDYNLLLQITQTYFELIGENFWYIVPDGRGRPTQIIPLRPDHMYIVPGKNDDRLIAGYEYIVDGKTIKFDSDEIIRMVYPNPTNVYRGLGTVRAAALAIDTDQFSAEYNRDFFYNSAIPKGAWVTEGRLTKETRKRMEARTEERHKARKNAHKPAILEGGVKWEDIGMSQKDMEFLNQRKFSRDEIFTLFGIPKDLMNTEDSNRASVKEAINIYMKFTVKPRMKKFVSMLNEFYLPLFDDGLFFDFEDPSPMDVEGNLKKAEIGARTETIFVNELRELLDLPPVDGGDEELASVGNFTNLLGEGEEEETRTIRYNFKKKQPPRAKTFTLNPKPEPKIKKDLREKIKKEIDVRKDYKRLIQEKKQLLLQEPPRKAKRKRHEFTKDQKEILWKVFDDQLEEFEDSYRIRLGSFLNGQRDRLLKQLRSRKSVDKGLEDVSLNISQERVRFVAKFREFIEKILLEQGNASLAFIAGRNTTFDLDDPEVRRFLGEDAFEFVSEINRTTKNSLKEELDEAIRQEESIQQISSRIEGLFRDIKKSRADTIARTETLRVFNFATLKGYDQSGVVQFKEWLSARDGRVRDSHQRTDGEVRRLDRRFSNGVLSPGYDGPADEIINCRCTLIPVVNDGFKFYLPDAWRKALNRANSKQVEDKSKKSQKKLTKQRKDNQEFLRQVTEEVSEEIAKKLKKEVDERLDKGLQKIGNDLETAINE